MSTDFFAQNPDFFDQIWLKSWLSTEETTMFRKNCIDMVPQSEIVLKGENKKLSKHTNFSISSNWQKSCFHWLRNILKKSAKVGKKF